MDYSQLSVSDGTGEAVVANIESDRGIGAITIDVDSVENFPANFIAATGTPNANNFINPATMTVFYGHTDSGNVVIDGFAPGYSDAGNTAGQILVIKPTTFWADEMVRLAEINRNPTGMISPYAGSAAPDNWLLCDGSEISRTDYAALFAVIGETYGAGDGSNTFALPNLKGRAVVGVDAAQTEFDTLGETGGAKTHTLTINEMPSHNHPPSSGTSILNYRGTGGNLSAPSGGTIEGNGSTGSRGGGQAHNNLQPYMALNYIIKT